MPHALQWGHRSCRETAVAVVARDLRREELGEEGGREGEREGEDSSQRREGGEQSAVNISKHKTVTGSIR